MFKTVIAILACGFCLSGCLAKRESDARIASGTWRASVIIQDHELPFNIDVEEGAGGYKMYLRNAEERILLDEITVFGDSIDIVLHVFDANFKAKISGDTMTGEFVKNYAVDYRLPFQAIYNQTHRFPEKTDDTPVPDFRGKYAVKFFGESDTVPAIGVFDQHGTQVTGTFLTPTGDYRYLEGNVGNTGTMNLSTFDGNHTYLFSATKTTDSTLSGLYLSGKTLRREWTAVKDNNAQLPDAEKLTYLREGYERNDFTFPDVEGRSVGLTDEKYKNKVVVIQLFGTWCPNCMDETKFLTKWYDENKDRGVEIIGLAYERKPDYNYARNSVVKMVRRYGVKYDVLIAGTDDKAEASKTLPMLNSVIAFPTTIFVGTDGRVKKIHTGFSGPGTGTYYYEFIEHFNETVNALLKERVTASAQPDNE
jgi:thiol-disulfide isomerase/thioredoxin